MVEYVDREQKAMHLLLGVGNNTETKKEGDVIMITDGVSKLGTKEALPNTCSSLLTDFKRLGIRPGMNILVHSSMSKVGLERHHIKQWHQTFIEIGHLLLRFCLCM
jgi:hypothetical protein